MALDIVRADSVRPRQVLAGDDGARFLGGGRFSSGPSPPAMSIRKF
jgi:hypothetical protein